MTQRHPARRPRVGPDDAVTDRCRLAFCGTPCVVASPVSTFLGETKASACCCQHALAGCSLVPLRPSWSISIPKLSRRCVTKAVAADSNPLSWIVSGAVSATATAWAIVAEKTLGVLPGGSNAPEREPDEGASSAAEDTNDEVFIGYGEKEIFSSFAAEEFRNLALEAEEDEDDDDGVAARLAAREAEEDADSDGIEERIAARRTQGQRIGASGYAGGQPKLNQRSVRSGQDAARQGSATVKSLPAGHTGAPSGKAAQNSRKERSSGGFFSFGRGQQSTSSASPSRNALDQTANVVSYGGLDQRRVIYIVGAALSRQSDASLDTPIPYDLQRQLFAEMQAPSTKKRRRKTNSSPTPKAARRGLKSHVSISRDVLRPVSQAVGTATGGLTDTSTELLGKVQRDMENLDSTKRKRKNGKEPRQSKAKSDAKNNVRGGGLFGFLFGWGSASKNDASADTDQLKDAQGGTSVENDGGAPGRGGSGSAKMGSQTQDRKSRRGGGVKSSGENALTDDLKNGREPVGKEGGFLNVPLELVGDLLKAVWWVKGQEGRSEENQGEQSTKTNVAAYAAAMTRDMTAMGETDISGAGAAAAAFAAASAIATSTQASELDTIEAAGLQASVTAARAIGSREDADVFVDTVGVGALVVATRVLSGQAQSSALTALANIAILRPRSRIDMLKGDGGSLIASIVDILHGADRFGAVSQVVDRSFVLCRVELLVSGAHLLGSLALAGGLVGSEWRRRMATDASLVSSLKKLAGGEQKGEPEGAARAARRALGALGINDWTPRIPGQRGLRILSIDGGGTRAIMAFEMLKHLEMLTGSRIADMFDVIGGTSTGAIVAASLGMAHKSVEDVESLYRRLIGKIFARNAGPVQGAKLLLTKAYYDTKVLEESLKRECGTGVFIDSLAEEGMNKVFVVSSIMSRSPQELHVFRNYTYPLGHESRYAGTSEAQLWEALRASSAAPTYFSEILVNGELHADGAIVANNPTAVALHETKCMYPGVPIECVVSMGNGLSAADIAAANQRSGAAADGDDEKGKSVGWGDVVGSIVASATNTEGVHYALDDLFPKSKYFRFNPVTCSNEIDETSAEKLADFVRDAQEYIERNPERFAEAARLLRPKTSRSLWRRFRDALGEELSALSAIEDDVYLL